MIKVSIVKFRSDGYIIPKSLTIYHFLYIQVFFIFQDIFLTSIILKISIQ